MQEFYENDFPNASLSERNLFENVGDILSDVKHEFFWDVDNQENYEKWSNLPGAYGSYCGNLENLQDPIINDPWPMLDSILNSKCYFGQGYDMLGIVEQIINRPALNSFRHTIYSENNKPDFLQLYSINTGTYIDNLIAGLKYTLESVKNGSPIVFGINCQPSPIEDGLDESTNNYIIIVGTGFDGRNYLLAWDPGCLLSNANTQIDDNIFQGLSKNNKIYLDSQWPGLLVADGKWSNFYANARQPYKVTQIFRTFLLR
ncbi:MAG: hypothetical protein JST10_12805 [Bacteroidetes bacterium]|nr:hypothetical protein [Bacteroidota bacterium]